MSLKQLLVEETCRIVDSGTKPGQNFIQPVAIVCEDAQPLLNGRFLVFDCNPRHVVARLSKKLLQGDFKTGCTCSHQTGSDNFKVNMEVLLLVQRHV